MHRLYNLGQQWLDSGRPESLERDIVYLMALDNPNEFLQYLRLLRWRSQQTWWRRWLSRTFLSRWMSDNEEPKSPMFTEFSIPLREHQRDHSMVVAMFRIKDDDPRHWKLVVTEHIQEY